MADHPSGKQRSTDEAAARWLDEVRHIVLGRLRGLDATVFLFGSFASGTARRFSDVDVAIDHTQPLPRGLLAEVREALEESHVPFSVDVVDLAEAEPRFRERVLAEGIQWSD